MSARDPVAVLAVVAWRASNGTTGHGCPLIPDLAAAWVKANEGRRDGLVHWTAPVGDRDRTEACARRGGPCDCGALAREALASAAGVEVER